MRLRSQINALRRHVFAGTKLHADDITLPVPALGEGKTRTARLWTHMHNDRASGDDTPPTVCFAYSPDRKGEHPRAHLVNFNGVLPTDAYAGFNAIYDTGRVVEAACWAHAQRKSYDLHPAHPTALTIEALHRMVELYAIEESIRRKPPHERRARRQQQAKPLLDDHAQKDASELATLQPGGAISQQRTSSGPDMHQQNDVR